MSVLTVGTVAFDDIETPFGKVEKVIGGACTYISWAASYFVNDIRLTSIVGGDFPQDEIKLLESRAKCTISVQKQCAPITSQTSSERSLGTSHGAHPQMFFEAFSLHSYKQLFSV